MIRNSGIAAAVSILLGIVGLVGSPGVGQTLAQDEMAVIYGGRDEMGKCCEIMSLCVATYLASCRNEYTLNGDCSSAEVEFGNKVTCMSNVDPSTDCTDTGWVKCLENYQCILDETSGVPECIESGLYFTVENDDECIDDCGLQSS